MMLFNTSGETFNILRESVMKRSGEGRGVVVVVLRKWDVEKRLKKRHVEGKDKTAAM